MGGRRSEGFSRLNLVIVPYTNHSKRRQRVLEAIRMQGYEPDPVWVGADDAAYWRLIGERWTPDADLRLVEHDIVPGPGVLAELDACPNAWCAFAYPYLHGDYPGLGCCRFRASVMQALPSAIERAGIAPVGSHPARHWCTLDHSLRTVLQKAGFTQCVHEGNVVHLGDNWPAHGCHGPKP